MAPKTESKRPDRAAPGAAPSSPPIPPAVLPSARFQRLWLVAFLTLYVGLQLFYVALTPFQTITLPQNLPKSVPQSLLVGLGPDEKEHYLYVLSLAHRREMPAPTPERRTSPEQYVSYQAQHPPLFYVLAAPVYAASQRLSGATIWYVLRGLGAICGLFTIVLTARSARVLFPDRPFVALAIVPAVALLPTFSFMTGTLSNQPLAGALGAWAWLQLVCLARGRAGFTPRAGVKLGLTLGLAVMARLTALLWLPAAAVVLLACARREAFNRRFVPLAAFALCLLAVISPWFLHNQAAFGSLFIRSENRPMLEANTFWQFLAHPLFPLVMMMTGLWYASTAFQPAWLTQFYVPGGVTGMTGWQGVALAFDALVIAALCLHAARSRRAGGGTDKAGRTLLWAGGLSLAFCIVAVFEQQLYSDHEIMVSAGRYLIDALPLGSALCLFALSVTFPTLDRRPIQAAGALAVLMLLFNLSTLSLLRQFYAAHPVQQSTQER